ncbi:MAG: hypothetical protein ABEI97_02675 [Candidatus Nanohaloarchaea archaeon]
MNRTMLTVAAAVLLAGCTGASPAAEPLPATAAVVAEYDPGTCYGMPTAVSPEMINTTLAQNPETAAFIRDRYATNSRFQTYSKLQQFSAVTLEETGDGYRFTVEDGNCCSITTYTGTVRRTADGYVIEETGNSTRTVPC